MISNGHIKIIVLCQILLWVRLDEQFQNTLDEEAESIDSVLIRLSKLKILKEEVK